MTALIRQFSELAPEQYHAMAEAAQAKSRGGHGAQPPSEPSPTEEQKTGQPTSEPPPHKH